MQNPEIETKTKKIRKFVDRGTEKAFMELDTLLNSQTREELLEIITAFGDEATPDTLATKDDSQLRARIRLLAIGEWELNHLED